MNEVYRIGLDIGSTTIKLVVLDAKGENVYLKYRRHNARIRENLLEMLGEVRDRVGDAEVVFHVTGSIGMGVAERCGLAFTQEVVAATNFIRHKYPDVSTMVDIGGEDTKVVFFENGESVDVRMNGNCAGGTGAFIDQMAILMGASVDDLNEWAKKAEHVHSIAARCGVFSKTDIQNLIAKNICKEDIAASVFHAVAVQVNVTLAHGADMKAPLLFCGGPLSFIPSLRKAFMDYLHMGEGDLVIPDHAHLIPAWGAALSKDGAAVRLSDLISAVDRRLGEGTTELRKGLEPIFTGPSDYEAWKRRMAGHAMVRGELRPGRQEVFLGIDSGSTTTKIVVLNRAGELLYSYYTGNKGNPVAAAAAGLSQFARKCAEVGCEAVIAGSCSTGYGEDLIKAAFRLDRGVVETIAHYMAARHIGGDISFILDIGGQDMKAIFVSGGVIDRMEINEACSSGCGSFIETFAKSLNLSVSEFAAEACGATLPYDLGTRCTVFMNSKVKQALREGASIGDIAAGLSYSVVKNCLYKVLRLKNIDELGERIVVQGGTMRNDSVVRAFEKLTGREVFRSDAPELMGAFGCALYAIEEAGVSAGAGASGEAGVEASGSVVVEASGEAGDGVSVGGRGYVSVDEIVARSAYETRQLQCHGCENQCLVTRYKFGNGNRYYSGNRCEKVFTNQGEGHVHGTNVYVEKLRLLFDREIEVPSPIMTVGIPRALNMYEEYPFWHALFSHCGIRVVLSEPSTFEKYEAKANLVMSDNICFPAKLVHSHVEDLVRKGVDRIFMPFVVFERLEGGENSYNCPVVAGYSEVIHSVQNEGVPVDSPSIGFKDRKALYRQCVEYFTRKLGVRESVLKPAFWKAVEAQDRYEREIEEVNDRIFAKSRAAGGLTILLAGRPYHADPLVQHKLSDMVAALGVDVITDDIVRSKDIVLDDAYFLPQWAYVNRILKAVKFAATQDGRVQCMEMTSFGCGPDAFLTDETRGLLRRYGKTLTLLKIDDIGNIGSVRLRVRSFIESLKMSIRRGGKTAIRDFRTTPPYYAEDRARTIIVPFFTPFISPIIPPTLEVIGYKVENLPVSDTASCEWGLKYANNEVCYPATLVVGDIVKAFKDGRYDPRTTAVAMTQTGGQCRASNYLSLIKRALVEAGYGNVPVISVAFGSGLENYQPGFKVNWLKYMPIMATVVLYTDSIAKYYYAASARESVRGEAKKLKDKYLDLAKEPILQNSTKGLQDLLVRAAREFDAICVEREAPKVGIVGEIYLKFNPFAQKNVGDWLVDQGIEVVPPMMLDFFIQSFVNYEVNRASRIKKTPIPETVMRWIFNILMRYVEKFNAIGSENFRFFTPFGNIFEEAEEAKKVVTLSAQFGEGWLLPGEVMMMARHGVDHVISMQPFGCIANHIISKGVEKKIRSFYPGMHILSLDFDSGVSDVNIMNRLLLFLDSLRAPAEG